MVSAEVEVVVGVRAPVEAAVMVLLEDPGSLFEPGAAPDAEQGGRFRASLAIDLTDGTILRHEVVIETGGTKGTERDVTLLLHLEPGGNHHLLPVFAGQLELRAQGTGSQLVLAGHYDVPLGLIGRVGDALGGHRWAERSLERFMTEVAERLEAEVERRTTASPPPVAPERQDQQPRHPDYYLG